MARGYKRCEVLGIPSMCTGSSPGCETGVVYVAADLRAGFGKRQGEVRRQATESAGCMIGDVVGNARRNGNATHVTLLENG